MVSSVRGAMNNSWIRSKFHPTPVKQGWIIFYIEAYIELLMSAIVCFDMFKIRKVWNGWDKFSVFVHFVGVITVVCFYIYICWVSFYKMTPLILKKKMEKKAKHDAAIKLVHEHLKETKRKNLETKKSIASLKSTEEEFLSIASSMFLKK